MCRGGGAAGGQGNTLEQLQLEREEAEARAEEVEPQELQEARAALLKGANDRAEGGARGGSGACRGGEGTAGRRIPAALPILPPVAAGPALPNGPELQWYCAKRHKSQ
jgi:hypothetical protein